MPSVWLLNLDADHELARPLGYAPTDSVRARVDALREGVRGDLFEAGDIELIDGTPLPPEARGRPGRAWCMTPRARKRLSAVGAIPIDAPELEILQRVNSRSFAYGLLAPRDASICTHELDRLRRFTNTAPTGTQWLAKRAHGMAGRGQRRLSGGDLSSADEQWLAKSCEAGSVLIEERRELTIECVVHGYVDADGGLQLGPVFQQCCDPYGAWLENRPSPAITPEELQRLCDAAVLAAGALTAAGYFGPFGLDSYAWMAGGKRCWNPLSDLNARYTMGWRTSGLTPHAQRPPFSPR